MDPKDILKDIENALKGRRFDEKEGKYIDSKDPLMNENGVMAIMNLIMKSRINRNAFLTNLDSIEVRFILKKLLKDLADKLFMDYELYDINENNLNLIIDLVEDTVLFSLNRAIGQGERKFLGGILDLRGLLGQQDNFQQQQSRGFFPKKNRGGF